VGTRSVGKAATSKEATKSAGKEDTKSASKGATSKAGNSAGACSFSVQGVARLQSILNVIRLTPTPADIQEKSELWNSNSL
jgi:hypothetical protein